MITENLEKLKTILLNSRDPALAMGYFIRHFGEHPEILKNAKKVKKSIVPDVLEKIWQQRFAIDPKQVEYLLLRLSKTSLIHGSIHTPERSFVIFYFDDINAGLLTWMDPSTPGFMDFLRISSIKTEHPLDEHEKVINCSSIRLH